MATDRIYGDFQTAGVKVTTAAKSQVNSAGTDAYARLVAQLGADGSAAGPGNPPAGSAPTANGTAGYTAIVTQTHGADTTAYGAMDVIGVDASTNAAVEFTGVGLAGEDVLLTGTEFEIDSSSIPSGQTAFYLALYSATPPSALVDNAPWDIPSGDRTVFRGIFPLGAPVDYGSTLYVRTDQINAQIHLTTTSLFGYIITATGYTPVASTVRKAKIHTVGLGI